MQRAQCELIKSDYLIETVQELENSNTISTYNPTTIMFLILYPIPVLILFTFLLLLLLSSCSSSVHKSKCLKCKYLSCSLNMM